MTEYVLGSDPAEIARLDQQAMVIAGASDALLRAAGIGPGMRVLDLGTGLGHVAAQVAELVGPTGSVVGVDRDARLLAIADQRVLAESVRFVEADVRTVQFDEPFDAVVCRLLLFHLPDAVDVMRHHRQASLRPGGRIVAIDYDTSAVRSVPPVPLLTQMNGWVEAAFTAAGADSWVGARLVPILREAGFADVSGFGIQAYFAPGDRPGSAMLAAVVRSLYEVIVSHGIASKEEVDIDTVAERLQREVDAAAAVVLPPTVVGAWGRA